ncbi:hypothetical protein M407DRAFT_20438 [Tulasnella calospora MUT 4182]|uniref:Uncharacterized protein n=1 Tax=Tulasnella calospora MUT 4182 TaxID=1051891 RepID=A0A0C3QG50_9AGAM|nr:hypothetical protein M407DRAFT_20438 [Tulasnella calospora MUT 4182]
MGEQNIPAAFTVAGSINSRAALDTELENIYEILETADADVASLLNRLAYGTPGIMEAVLVSRTNDGFAFRRRIMKALLKSSESPDSIYQICADRMGRFLAGLPPSINLDRRVMEQHNAFTDALNVVNSPEAKSPIEKTAQPVADSPPKSTKRKQKFIPLSISIGPPLPKKEKSVSVSPTRDRRQPPSPTVALNGPKSQSFPELLRTCLETYFAACMEEGIEEFAANSLLAILSPSLSPQLSVRSPLSPRQFEPYSPLTDITSLESPVLSRPGPLPYFSLAPNDIAQYLAAAASPKFGDWPVVVSQRGIKHLKQYADTNTDVFLRVQKRIKWVLPLHLTALNTNIIHTT